MKRLVLAALLVLAVAGSAFAGAQNNVGCGLGSVLWGNNADNSVFSQTLMMTTNHTFYTQSFGVTTGTSNCSRPSNIVQNEKLERFVQENMDSLAKDIAAGKGEYLDTFAELMSVPSADRAAFNAKLQKSFAAIYTSDKVEMAQVIDAASAVK